MKVILFLTILAACGAVWAQDVAATQPAAPGLNPLLFPGAEDQGTPQTQVRALPGCELVHLTTASGEKVVAMYGPALDSNGDPYTNPKLQPTFIYFYGNGSCIAISRREFSQFRRIGVNVLMPDYVGYGMSSGKPSEAALYETADACYDYLVQLRGVAAKKIYAAGWSLGAAVATDLASRREVAGLAIFNAFTSMADMAHVILPWLPASATVAYKFDNLAKIGTIHAPVFICNGLRDELVPPQMSEELAKAAGGKVTRVRIPMADHNSIFMTDPALVFGSSALCVKSMGT
jgi:fermentation-respiration switch protein FrsA (DUF1100 family)